MFKKFFIFLVLLTSVSCTLSREKNKIVKSSAATYRINNSQNNTESLFRDM